MSWHSTLDYYRLINEMISERLGGNNSAEVIIKSVNFADITDLMNRGDWTGISYLLAQAKTDLEFAGADIYLLCSNTVHHAIPGMKRFTETNFLHIAEVTADKVVEKKMKKVALLGTKFTITQDFYKKSLESRGLEVLIPGKSDTDFINHVIFEELCHGVIRKNSKIKFLRITNSLIKRGAEGIVLGCTELPLIIEQDDSFVPLFNTTKIHAEAAVDLALAEDD
jgi:aspartate racemase